MNKLIKNYIYAVIRRVEEKDQLEISRELESNIYDMLSNYENPTDEKIIEVLKNIGNPIEVASRYQKSQKHIVHPAFYYDYINTLKIVFLCLCGLTLLGLLTYVLKFEFQSDEIGHLIGDIIEQFFSEISQIVFTTISLVTIGFWIASANMDSPKMKSWLQNWDPKKLMDAPSDLSIKTASRFQILIGTIIGSIFTLTFFIIFSFGFEKIGLYTDKELIASFFNHNYKWLLIGLAAVSTLIYFAKEIYYSIKLKKDSIYEVFELVSAIYSLFSVMIIFTIKDLINPEFITNFSQMVDITSTKLTNYLNISIQVVLAIIIVVSIFQIVFSINKLVKKNTTLL